MRKPSSISEVWGLTGDYNTEQVILGLARACAGRGDVWQAVPVQDVETVCGEIAWDTEAAEREWTRLMQRLIDAGIAPREKPADVRLGLLDLTTAGRFISMAITGGWVQLAEANGQLGIKLAERTLACIERLA